MMGFFFGGGGVTRPLPQELRPLPLALPAMLPPLPPPLLCGPSLVSLAPSSVCSCAFENGLHLRACVIQVDAVLLCLEALTLLLGCFPTHECAAKGSVPWACSEGLVLQTLSYH